VEYLPYRQKSISSIKFYIFENMTKPGRLQAARR
jgi:hypothetical protein